MAMIPDPTRRRPADKILARMRDLRDRDGRWQQGRTWSLVWGAGGGLAACGCKVDRRQFPPSLHRRKALTSDA